MKTYLKNIFLFIGLSLTVLSVKADIGETHSMKLERRQLMQELEALTTDSLRNGPGINELSQQIIALDAKIFASYEESISRMSSQKVAGKRNARSMVYLALAASLVAVIMVFLILLARKKILENSQSSNVFAALSSDLIHDVSPEKATARKMLRVHLVVVVGLVLMSVSVVAFLFSKL